MKNEQTNKHNGQVTGSTRTEEAKAEGRGPERSPLCPGS